MAHHTPAHPAAFERYARTLVAWLDAHASDDADVFQAAAEVCREAHANAARAEHLLTALHDAGAPAAHGTARDSQRERRYIDAVAHVIESCFGEPQPMLRVARTADGHDWTILLVREAFRRDGKAGPLRKDWLCCVTNGERRYITPVPRHWDQWTDAELASAIGKARPDIRGPR